MNTYKEETVTVGKLMELYKSNIYDIEVLTPDGYQSIINWWDKGLLPMIEINAEIDNKLISTKCAFNHLLQEFASNEYIWKLASELCIGDKVLTENGIATINNISIIDDQECYDFEINHPNHRYWGDGFSSHNSGKSFICSGNIVRNAQQAGIFPILIDTENALDENWLRPLGVDTGDDKLLKVNMSMIDDVAKLISDFMKDYKVRFEKIEPVDRPKILFVLDSLGMLLTPTDVNQFQAGELKGDMGRKPKALTALVRNCVNMFGEYDVGLVVTNHSYQSQDMFNPDDVISGGQGFVFASSIVVAMRKMKLKEDEDGKKTTDVKGIRAACKVMKTRYNKPFESVEIKIPWESGMDKYSGLIDMFEKKGLLVKDGNKLKYIDSDKQEHKYFRSSLPDTLLDLIMLEWDEAKISTSVEMVENIEENGD